MTEGHALTTQDREVFRLKVAASRMGRDDAEAAVSWLEVPDVQTAAQILEGLRDGDPAVWDRLPAPDLSGQWADGRLPADFWEDADVDRSDRFEADPYFWADVEADVCDAYDEEFSQKVDELVSRECARMLDLEREFGDICWDCVEQLDGDPEQPLDPEREIHAREVEIYYRARGFEIVTASDPETGDGIVDFSWAPCALCGSRLGGGRERAVVVRMGPTVWADAIRLGLEGRTLADENGETE